MMQTHRFLHSVRPRHRRGLSLIEVSVSSVLVGLLIIGAMRCLTASVQTGEVSTERAIAMLLAEDLMEEILQQDYAEPVDTAEFGIEGSESARIRSAWDDVDDYDSWKMSPPADQDGNAVEDGTWSRKVIVSYVNATDPETPLSDDKDTGVKRITVTVFRNGEQLAELVSLQTSAWISTIPEFAESTTTGRLPPANESPTARISSHVMSGTRSVTVNFDGGSSTDPNDDPLEYNWSLGGDATDTGESVSHTFTNSGSDTLVFNITLTVNDIHGAVDSATSTVTVYP